MNHVAPLHDFADAGIRDAELLFKLGLAYQDDGKQAGQAVLQFVKTLQRLERVPVQVVRFLNNQAVPHPRRVAGLQDFMQAAEPHFRA